MTGRPAGAEAPGPGQESCWDYPRPPAVDQSTSHVTVDAGRGRLAESRRAVRVLETSHPPTWYLPPEDVDLTALAPSSAPGTVCEFKGVAEYLDVLPAEGRPAARAAAWRYPRPRPGYEALAGWVAFFAHRLECRVDGVLVQPQAGSFYGGWITPDVVGPFKGGPGTVGW